VVVLDDGGLEWFDWSGLAKPATGHVRHPRLTEMRQMGVAFTRAYANPICAPTRARLWSSRYAFELGLAGNPGDAEDFAFGGGGAPLDDWQHPAPITTKLWPRLLANGCAAGGNEEAYARACFGKVHL